MQNNDELLTRRIIQNIDIQITRILRKLHSMFMSLEHYNRKTGRPNMFLKCVAISFRPTWEKLTNQNCIAFAKKLREYWSPGSLLLFGPDSVSTHLLIKNMPMIISRIMRCLEPWCYLGKDKVHTYKHTYIDRNIYTYIYIP